MKNKKKIMKFINILLCVFSVLLIVSCTQKKSETEDQKWTWLFYNDADGDVAKVLEYFSNIAHSNPNFEILILHDPLEDEAVLYYLGVEHHPELTVREFGREVISIVDEYWSKSGNETFTLSAIDTKKIDNLVTSIDEVTESYLTETSNFLDKWNSIEDSIQAFGSGQGNQMFRDIFDMADNLITVENDPQLIEKLENLKENLTESIIAEYHGTDFPRANGLTIFFRADINYFYTFWCPLSSYYDPEYGLDFVADTKIDELQIKYFGGKNEENNIYYY